jgi:hypothetical protein
VKAFFKLIFLFLITGTAGCSVDNSPPSTSEIVGTYLGRYGGGDETFEIRTNGTFSQTFQIGTNVVYAMDGKWQFEEEMNIDGKWQLKTNLNGELQEEKISNEKRTVKINRVKFEPFMIPNGVLGNNSKSKVDVGSGSWSRNPIRIEFGAWPYLVDKVAGQGATVGSTSFKSP